VSEIGIAFACMTVALLGALVAVVLVAWKLPPSDRQWLNDMTNNYLSAYERGQANAKQSMTPAPWMSTPGAPAVTGPEGPSLPDPDDEGVIIGKN
jgi:hypothetical protein